MSETFVAGAYPEDVEGRLRGEPHENLKNLIP
jgi:hypothetical protein